MITRYLQPAQHWSPLSVTGTWCWIWKLQLDDVVSCLCALADVYRVYSVAKRCTSAVVPKYWRFISRCSASISAIKLTLQAPLSLLLSISVQHSLWFRFFGCIDCHSGQAYLRQCFRATSSKLRKNDCAWQGLFPIYLCSLYNSEQNAWCPWHPVHRLLSRLI